MKYFFYLVISSLFIISCKKHKPYTITITNPENYSVKIGSGNFVGGIIEINETETYSGTLHKDSKKVGFNVNYDKYNEGEHNIQHSSLSFDVGDGGDFYHTVGSDVVTGGDADNPGSSNSLDGTWAETSACSNANGEHNHYYFGSNSGYFFQSDCNSVCAPNYGVKFPFTYTSTSSSFTLTHSTPDGGCGTTLNTPSDITMNYTISGSNLTVTNPNNGASTTLVKQ